MKKNQNIQQTGIKFFLLLLLIFGMILLFKVPEIIILYIKK